MNAVSLNKILTVPFFPNYFLSLLICSKRENKLSDLEPAPNSVWGIPTHTTAKPVTGKLTEAACLPRREYHIAAATASVLKPTKEKKIYDSMDSQYTGVKLWSSAFQILLYLPSDLFVAHLTEVWAGGKLWNKEPGITSPRSARVLRQHLWNSLPGDFLHCSTCRAVESLSIQATS